MSDVAVARCLDRLGSPTIVDDYWLRLQLEHLWNADRCPALSRERRVEMIRELGWMLENV
ncbi:hypothetical protein IVB45_18610 [Bradyrhizobium sp. 4]|uniref:hypothetical protein n=1 Tax=unclassified Bradyrhizobium TaxID=2631580 RepID=UPI001FF84081|nr:MULTISPECIES: hypothetical protein [unclassified Bradyrhizobium]MCK1400134.1 hypothetical protein [Bradyrhizobium sp. 39]MCK1750424.1 hypothetical protein [Bradyrhizobium sp. 135]UPJ32033.1 hypothetical protein IVB45_18610 [Bradyrhizobium sp. 4]